MTVHNGQYAALYDIAASNNYILDRVGEAYLVGWNEIPSIAEPPLTTPCPNCKTPLDIWGDHIHKSTRRCFRKEVWY